GLEESIDEFKVNVMDVEGFTVLLEARRGDLCDSVGAFVEKILGVGDTDNSDDVSIIETIGVDDMD
ncbi:hypothetical protein KI387_005397, partial [Taxus chinensis]